MTADEVHQLGLLEVERIKGRNAHHQRMRLADVGRILRSPVTTRSSITPTPGEAVKPIVPDTEEFLAENRRKIAGLLRPATKPS
jgi:uncharacterized protein (DUF885 family)